VGQQGGAFPFLSTPLFLSRESGAFASGERGKISGQKGRKTIFPCSGDSGAFFLFPLPWTSPGVSISPEKTGSTY